MTEATASKGRKRYVLRGHRSDVNTICVNNEQDVLVSGSEDGCVRLWDLKRERRSFKCAKSKEAVTSVDLDASNEMNLFVASGQNIYQYDLRVPSVVMTSTEAVFGFKSRRKKREADEEINRVNCHPDGTLIVAGNDSGEVVVFDVKKLAQGLRPRYVHSNICTTVEWRPNASRHVFTSGALDCTVVGWDYDNKRKYGHIEMNSTEETSSSQLFNPPFVHSLSYSHDGKIFAAAVGDGTVGVYDANTYESACVEDKRLEGHSTVTCEVKFARFDMNGVYGLLSACQSESILLRRLYSKEDSTKDEVSKTASKNSTSSSKRGKRRRRKKKNKNKKSVPCVARMESEIMLRLNHGEKINALETTKSGDVIVADTSSEIHIYTGLLLS
mgnify:CR=1 FL=1